MEIEKSEIRYMLPAPHWARSVDELKKDGYEPIIPSLAHSYMKQIAEIMEAKGYYPSIYYGVSDIEHNAIGGLQVSEGFESDGSDYSLDVEFMKDGIYILGEFGCELEKASIEEVYEFFKEF